MARPKKTGNQFCPICKKQGFSYRNTVKISNTDSYFYIRFCHNDQTLKDHDTDRIVKEKEPLKHATEYNRGSMQVTSFVYNRYLNNIKYDPIKHWDKNKAIPIVIYNINMMKIPVEFKDEIKKIAVTEKEKDWILNSEPVKTQFRVKHFYNEILNSGIVTIGDNALEYREKIYEVDFISNVSDMMDKFGMFDEILKMRKKKKNLSKSCYETHNYPRRTLELTTQKERIDK